MNASPPFLVLEPLAPGPVVVEVPHAGTAIDAVSARFTRVPERAVLADADIQADALFAGTTSEGATVVVATPSRYVIDLNTPPRLPTPYEDKLPPGLGDVRRTSVGGDVWFEKKPPRMEIERRVREVFEPYHETIALHLAAARARHAGAILISAHSYPDVLFPHAADVVIGTRRGTSAPAAMAEEIARVVRQEGLTVAHDDPFPGGYALARHAGTDAGVQGLQIEVARRLYCDETGVPRAADVTRIALVARRVVAALTVLTLAR